jgi:hypothetical protein
LVEVAGVIVAPSSDTFSCTDGPASASPFLGDTIDSLAVLDGRAAAGGRDDGCAGLASDEQAAPPAATASASTAAVVPRGRAARDLIVM